MTPNEYADLAGVHVRTVKKWLQTGRLPDAAKIDGAWLIPEDARPIGDQPAVPAVLPPAELVRLEPSRGKVMPVTAAAALYGATRAELYDLAADGVDGLKVLGSGRVYVPTIPR